MSAVFAVGIADTTYVLRLRDGDKGRSFGSLYVFAPLFLPLASVSR